MMKTLIAILSYNNPELTDRLVENLKLRINIPYDLMVYDNGSSPDKISKYTTNRGQKNCRMTRGFNEIIKLAKESGQDYNYFWFFTNDCYFVSDTDPLENMLQKMSKYPNIGILHPSMDQNVRVSYDIKNKKQSGVKIVVEYDFVCPMFSKRCLEAVGGAFNHNLFLGWGIDHETSYLSRKNEMQVGINHDLIVMHNTSSTYDNGFDCKFKDRKQYYSSAFREMYSVLNNQYGINWNELFKKTFTDHVGEWYE